MLETRKIRMGYRILYETFLDICRSGWSNWIVICILTSVLAIFGLVLQISFGLNQIGKKLTDQLEFSVYLSSEVDVRDFALIASKMENVKRVEVVDREVAWEEFKKNFTISEDFQNPLPDTIHVRVENEDKLKRTIEEIKKMPGVVDINYAPGVVGFINKLKRLLQVIGAGLTVLLAFVTVVVTANTIQLVIHLRHNEIEILRLMGVEDWYIKGPFILQGIFYAFVAASLATLPLYAIQSFFWDTAKHLLGSAIPTGLPKHFTANVFHIYYFLLVFGILVSGTGCIWSTKKYLKV